MTTFQDPPPQSRRAVRQSERGENPEQVQPYSFDPASPEAAADAARADAPATGGHRAAPANAGPATAEPLNYMTQARPHQASQPASSAPQPSSPTDAGTFRVRDYSPEGRRAAISREQFSGITSTPAAPPAVRPLAPRAETPPSSVDLDYFTQGAPVAITPPPAPVQPPIPVAPHDERLDHTLTRRELREMRAAQERQAPQLRQPEPIDNILNSGPIQIPVLSVLPGQSKALADAMAEFDLLARKRTDLEPGAPTAIGIPMSSAPPAPVAESPVAAPTAVAPAAVEAVVPEPAEDLAPPVLQAPPVAPASDPQPFPFKLTAPSATEAPAPAAFVPPPLVEPQPLPTGPLSQALLEPQLVSLADLAPELAEPATAPVDETAHDELIIDDAQDAATPVDVTPVPPVSAPFVAAPPSVPVAPQYVAPQSVLAPPVFEDVVAPAPVAQAPVASVPVAFVPVASVSVPSAPQIAPHADSPVGSANAVFLEPERTTSRPVGHWSVQAEMDDEEVELENTVTRTVGAGTAAITTSALVLPSVPEMGDLIHPFTSTGEILVTGSIDLPRSLGATGAHPHRVDNSDFEDDPLDSQVVSTDSAPVRAIRAISTHTSTRGVIEQKRRQSSRMPAVMIVVASVLALGVVALLVVAAVTHLF